MTSKRVVIIGIGGASCSGKTLLAKHLRRALPSACTIIHQDDFAPPMEQVPYSQRYPDLQDWDDPPTCILWPKFRELLENLHRTGVLPEGHQSQDHLNKQVEVEVDEGVFEHWREELRKLEEDLKRRGEELVWYIIDGFVLYWDPQVVSDLDTRILLRVPHDSLKRRRDERQTYVLQRECNDSALISDPDDAAAGGVWTDPPQYFEKTVYPAYVKAHEHLFVGKDVEEGDLSEEWIGRIEVVQPREGSAGMTGAFETAAASIVKDVRKGKGSVVS